VSHSSRARYRRTVTDAAPLDGVHVLDCSRVLAGPFATWLLAGLGADVTKVEPPDGDETRGWGPPWWGDPDDRISAYWASVNAGKRLVTVDLKTDAGRAQLDRLAAGSDVLVHNYTPSTARRLGLDAASLHERHPQLVVAVVGGYPSGSPHADRPAYDLLMQAVCGLMAITGAPDGPPTKVGVAVLDLIAGVEVALGAVAALLGRSRDAASPETLRHRDGSARRRVEVSLVEAGVTSLVNVLGNYLASGREPTRHGNAHANIVPYQAFEAADGYLAIAVGNDRQFAALVRVLGLGDDPRLLARFTTNPDRVAGRDALIPILEEAVRRRRRDELVAALTEADVPAGPVNSVGEAVEMLRSLTGASWTVRSDGIEVVPSPIRIGT
jgi:crotonobetainyl-CoA:carnitine CoA-transferase CaiB-like acyl-CoA transferase